MDLRQFGKYNQFKILKQDAIKEVTRYVRGYKLYVVHIKLIDLAMMITKRLFSGMIAALYPS